MGNPKCRYCKKELKRQNAYKVTENNKNIYYCNEDHYLLYEKQLEKNRVQNIIKNKVFETIYEIFEEEQVTHTALYKEMNELDSIYGYRNILDYLNENKDMLSDIMSSKDFKNEYAKIRYFSAILKNNMSDFIKTSSLKKENNINREVEYEDVSNNFHRKKKKKSLEEYEKESW